MFAFVNRNAGSDGVEGVDTRADIGAGVRAVEPSHYSGEEIAPPEGVKIRAQVMPVWPDCVNGQADSHADKQKCSDAVKFRPVLKKEIGYCHENIGEPQKVGNYKYFQKRDVVIKC